MNNCVSWQKSIGYVPQNIFIADDTIAANIAFGLEKENINHDQIQKSS
jgi:ABC-type multidrug transport system fused ATPase/permease subunit